ncbi:O-methyltransferase, putative [Shewanella piezotolerans WP3]|uniref:O-methyltransferase, putative n=1 Tax=Shewanella piezotolerans (strain WP3 / JCM 13877) TaxID=225849 RepID=B8CNR4_SHEPW|nr:class I SAM-dependent methyltransferase [Shewanella piezotolerans]ACJ29033.1 O-methyltransferase, putative [Shewanella piezotolerans WP3]
MKMNTLAASLILTGAFGLSTLSATANAHVHENAALDNAVTSDFRQTQNSARDKYRHPKETIEFFDVQPTDTVIELWPGGGWYAEILAPYLANKGHYIGGNFNANPDDEKQRNGYRAKAGKKFEKWIADNQAKLGNASTVTFDPPSFYAMGDDNSADVVLTFRNLHNWAMKGYLEPVFDSAYKVLKSGGTFGIVEHRANPGMDPKTGYMDQAQMIKLAEKAGFTFVESSEINANAKDTKDYPKGVWTLPPRLALDDQDKEKYLAIGESDRMTLKFIKK